MIKLLQFEWRKLWRQKSLYICFGIGLGIIFLSLLSMKVFEAVGDATSNMIFTLNSGFVAFLGIFIAIIICQDFSQQTIKNIYARGYRRSSVYLAKYIISLSATLLMALLYMSFGFILTLILGGEVGSLLAWQWGVLSLQLWALVGFHGLFFGVSMMIRVIGGAVALNLIGISFAFTILSLIFTLFEIDFNIMKFSLENLFSGLADTLLQNQLPTQLLIRAILLPFAYVVIFVGLGWFINQRRDV